MSQCVFVNTDEPAIRVERLGVFQYWVRENEILFEEMCELFYPHPDAPDHATVSVYRWLSVKSQEGTEHLIKQSIDAMHGVGKITELT